MSLRRMLIRLLGGYTAPPQPVAHRLAPCPDKEMERENRYLAKVVGERDREIAAFNRLLTTARMEGRIEGYERAAYIAVAKGADEVAELIAKLRENP